MQFHESGVSFMGWFYAKKRRVPHLIIAVLAVLGLEFDVLCNPFAPTLILHRILRALDAPETVSADPGDRAPIDSTATVTPVQPSRWNGAQSDRPDGPSHLDELPEIDDTVTVRAPSNASSLAFVDTFVWVALPWPGHVSHVQETHFPIISRPSLLTQLCRFLC